VLYSSLGNNGYATFTSPLPRIAVAGAKPTFFAPQVTCDGKETFSLSEIQKWAADDALWAQRMKRQAALSWQNDLKKKQPSSIQSSLAAPTSSHNKGPKTKVDDDRVPVSYILATHQITPGTTVMNCDPSKSSSSPRSSANQYDVIDLNSKVGNCVPLANVRIGTWVHDIECRPGQGGKMVRAAGTFAKVVQEPGAHCVLRLPSGAEKTVDSKCRATIGIVSNPSHGARKLTKAGHSRWLGRRPVVRGVAMNPVDHPHGGGEGRTKGGRPSVSPWGKPTKAGYRSPSVASRKA
jgi:ribosomal protein L2